MKTGIKMLGSAAFLFGVYLYSNKETPTMFVRRVNKNLREKKQAYKNWQAAYQNLKQSVAELKTRMPELEKTLTAIQRDIDEAQFQIQPRIDEINKYASKMKQW